MTDRSDVKKIAFGYYLLGFIEGRGGEKPSPDALDAVREKFEREWTEVGELGRKALQGE